MVIFRNCLLERLETEPYETGKVVIVWLILEITHLRRTIRNKKRCNRMVSLENERNKRRRVDREIQNIYQGILKRSAFFSVLCIISKGIN